MSKAFERVWRLSGKYYGLINSFLRNRHESVVLNGQWSKWSPILGPKIWESVPNDLKRKESVSSFKTAIKKWKPEQCPCRLCKTYLQNIGYL